MSDTNNQHDSDTIEIFPGTGGNFQLPAGISIDNIKSSVVDTDVIIQVGDSQIKIIYGAIFTAMGHEFTLVDESGRKIQLNEISHEAQDFSFFESLDTKEFEEFKNDLEKVDALSSDVHQQESLIQTIAELEDKLEELEKAAQDNIEQEEEQNIADAIEQEEQQNVSSDLVSSKIKANTKSELLTLKDIVEEAVQSPDESVSEEAEIVVPAASAGVGAENVEVPPEAEQDFDKPFLDWRLTDESDSGVSSSDMVTNVDQPIINGNSEPNTVIRLYSEAGELLSETISNDEGEFEFTLQEDQLNEGNNTYTVTATDDAENVNEVTRTINLDTSARIELSIEENTEALSEGIYKDSSPLLFGEAEVGSRVFVRVYDQENNLLWSSTEILADDSGQWTVPESDIQSFDDGSYRVEASVTDIAGNTSTAQNTFQIDTTVIQPTINIEPEDLIEGYTNIQQLRLSGTAEANASVNLTIRSNEQSETIYEIRFQADDNGVWSHQLLADLGLADGDYQVSVYTIDQAGNRSEESEVISWTLDTDPPDLEWQLTDETDTGSSNNDLMTNIAEAVITGSSEPNTKIFIYKDAELVAETMTNENGEFEYVLAEEYMQEGSNRFTIQAQDQAHNVTEVSHTVILDTHSELELSIEENPDASIANVYKDPSPGIFGTAEVGAKVSVELYDDDNNLVWSVDNIDPDEQGVWSVPESVYQSLDDGNYTVKASATDTAANETTITQDITIDTQPPIVEWQLAEESDGGVIGDLITNINSPTIYGQIDPSERLVIEDADGNPFDDINLHINEEGEWTAEFSDLADGIYEITVKITDIAGNVATETKTIEIDTIPPEPTEILITNNNLDEHTTSAGAIDLSGMTEANAQVTLIISGGELDSDIEVIIDADADGLWEFHLDFDQFGIDEGNYSIQSTVRDVAGNFSESDYVDLIIDRNVLPPTISLAAESDTGSSDTDLNTSDTKPLIVGTAEANSLVTLFIDGVEIAEIVVGEDGVWEYQIPDSLEFSEGEHTLEAYTTDRIDNVSTTEEVTITIDLTSPNAPDAYASDTIFSNDDEFLFSGNNVPENHKLYLIIHTADGSEFTYEIEVDADGNWQRSLSPDFEFSDGNYQIGLVYEDLAGNLSTESELTELEISTTSIEPAENIRLHESDSGQSDNDGVTNIQTLTVLADASADTIALSFTYSYMDNDGNMVNRQVDAVQNSDGAWQADIVITNAGQNLSDGVDITVTAENEDRYGNSSVSTEDLEVTYDIFVEDIDIQMLSSNTNLISNVVQPEFTLSAEESVEMTVSLYFGDQLLKQVSGLDIDANTPINFNFWMHDPAMQALADGDYQIRTSAQDVAGNITESTLSFTIDTEPPDDTSIALDPDAQGLLENLLSTNMPLLIGTAESYATVKIYNGDPENGGTLLAEIQADQDGNWQTEVTLPEVNGNYSLYTITTDQAGNDTVSSQPLEIELQVLELSPPGIEVDENTHPTLPGEDDVYSSSSSSPVFKITGLPIEQTIILTIYQGDEIIYQQTLDTDSNGELLFNQGDPQQLLDFTTQGNNQFRVEYTDQYGNESPSSDDVGIFIDTVMPEIPTIELVSDSVAQQDDVEVFNTRSLNFQGEATPGDELHIQFRRVGTSEWTTFSSVIVLANGLWNLTDTSIILPEDGEYEYRALSEDSVGNERASDELDEASTILIDTVSEFEFTSSTSIKNTDRELTATVEEGASVNILSITLDGIELDIDFSEGIDGTVNGDQWVLDLADFLPPDALDETGRPIDGVYEFVFEITDPYENSRMDEVTIEIKSSIDDPLIDSLVQDEGSQSGMEQAISEGDVIMTFDATPILIGRAEAFSQILITSQATGINQTVADADGNWQIELNSLESHSNQEIQLLIISQDEFGNASQTTTTIHYDDAV